MGGSASIGGWPSAAHIRDAAAEALPPLPASREQAVPYECGTQNKRFMNPDTAPQSTSEEDGDAMPPSGAPKAARCV